MPGSTFQVVEAYVSTRRGLVLLGEASGPVAVGNWLAFSDGTRWRVISIGFAYAPNRPELFGLFVDASVSAREELLGYAVGFTAEIVTN